MTPERIVPNQLRCPFCRAEPGQPCVGRVGRSPHPERWRAARQAMRPAPVRRYAVGPCRDPLRLWYVEREADRSRRYFSSRTVAREVARELRAGRLDFDADHDFERFV